MPRQAQPEDKVISLAEAAALVSDGATVALGGGLSHREPMALVRELVRQARRDLHLVGSAHGIDVDLLVGGGCVRTVEESYVGFEQDFGLAPAFRRAAEGGTVEVRETCCYTLLQQLRAAEMGLSFMPVRGIIGSDILGLHPEFGEVECPFTGQSLVAVPPLAPDVALIHVPVADRSGNSLVPRPAVLDERFAHASERVVVSAERIVPTGSLTGGGVTLPSHVVTAVTEARFGAHPTSCYPDYTYDRQHIARWVGSAATETATGDYITEVVGRSEQEYQAVCSDQLARIKKWSSRNEVWQELMS